VGNLERVFPVPAADPKVIAAHRRAPARPGGGRPPADTLFEALLPNSNDDSRGRSASLLGDPTVTSRWRPVPDHRAVVVAEAPAHVHRLALYVYSVEPWWVAKSGGSGPGRRWRQAGRRPSPEAPGPGKIGSRPPAGPVARAPLPFGRARRRRWRCADESRLPVRRLPRNEPPAPPSANHRNLPQRSDQVDDGFVLRLPALAQRAAVDPVGPGNGILGPVTVGPEPSRCSTPAPSVLQALASSPGRVRRPRSLRVAVFRPSRASGAPSAAPPAVPGLKPGAGQKAGALRPAHAGGENQ